MAKLNDNQRRIVKLKVAGKKQKEIGRIVYPNAKPASQEVLVSKELRKVKLQDALEQAYAKHNLTPDRLVKPISDALDADKVVIVGKDEDAFAEVTPDHSVRLKAASLGLGLIGANNRDNQTPNYTFIQIVNEDKDEFTHD